ncbi:MAG TPA: dihydrofolate reductase family protein [Ktedonobacterales bacterium]|nr:dihydrofolate reductase family protein [Ktedonobacterales bacterium]
MATTNARRVVANITLSLDGRTAGPGGDYDMGWIVPYAVTDMARNGLVGLTSATTVLLGRKNYEGFGAYWPTVAQDENADPRDRAFAQWLDRVEKVAFSSTLKAASWSNSRLVSDDPVTVVRALRLQNGGDIVILASQSIIRALLEADEVDRLSINLAPELVGAGAHLFQDGIPASSWALTDIMTSASGAVWLYYDRKR